MRIHPNLLAPRGARWQYPAAAGFLLLLLLVNVFRGPSQSVVATQAPVKMIEVVVTKKGIEAGQPFDQTNLVIEQRPASTLPSDVVTNFQVLNKKVAAGPIPAGYPLAAALLAEPMPLLTVSEDQERAMAGSPQDPIETMMKQIALDTAAVTVNLSNAAPARGTRVALTITGIRGDVVVVADEAWVDDANGMSAVLRVPPTKALFLESAKKLGSFNAIQIPQEGVSPYAEGTVSDLESLQVALGFKSKSSAPTPIVKSDEPRKFRNYAWVSGAGVRYGIDEKGNMFRVDADGKEIAAPQPESFK